MRVGLQLWLWWLSLLLLLVAVGAAVGAVVVVVGLWLRLSLLLWLLAPLFLQSFYKESVLLLQSASAAEQLRRDDSEDMVAANLSTIKMIAKPLLLTIAKNHISDPSARASLAPSSIVQVKVPARMEKIFLRYSLPPPSDTQTNLKTW